MGRVADAVRNWVNEKIESLTVWLRDFVAQKIEDLRVQIAVTRHDFRNWLAEFVATTHGFWITIGVIVVGTVASIYIQQTEQWIALVAKITTIKEKLVNATGSILARTGYSLINAGHKVMLLLNEDYAAAWQEFYSAFGALSEELKLGVSTINLMIRNARTLVFTAANFAGFDELAAHAEFDGPIAEFMSRVESRFERYARNPELIFDDIDREVVWPSIELMRAGQSDLLVRLDTVIAVVDEKATLLRTLEDNFDQLITDLPDEIEAAFRIHWDPARKYIDSFYDQYIAPVLDTANVIRTEVHELLDRQQEQLVRLLTDNQNPGDLLANVLTLPEPLRSRQLDRINAIFQLAGYFEAQRKRTRAQQIFKREQFRLNGYLRRLAQKRTIVAEVPSYTPAVREISTIDAWYKGISP